MAKADRFGFAALLAASYDSAGQEETKSICSCSSCGEKQRHPSEQMNRFTYVYILQSDVDLDHFYIGRTTDLRSRILRHNSGQVRHTAKWKPWRIKTYVALSDSSRAIALERYLKSASGRAFIKKRL
jgi:predicted GIY-YIG superfamily endonuclease